MKMDNALALVLLTMMMSGCSDMKMFPETPEWYQLNSMNKPSDPLWRNQLHCTKRGCHHDKPMLFDPSKAEPSVNSMHRGW
ncbi:hypothetical protein [Pseudomonas sp. SDI]|uniref:hypothetical protein n=1 Tax=Pseudomonas sp. SDI TaxID=2170734 RepID=UPI001057E500|nr:hypothetical protein [Pseudomonas sp. SDI]